MGWGLAAVFDEYGRYAGGKGEGDLEFIELFREPLRVQWEWCPEWCRVEGVEVPEEPVKTSAEEVDGDMEGMNREALVAQGTHQRLILPENEKMDV